jgi:hypothetical protein
MYHPVVRQLMYEISIYITIIVTLKYTMQSNHQYINKRCLILTFISMRTITI